MCGLFIFYYYKTRYTELNWAANWEPIIRGFSEHPVAYANTWLSVTQTLCFIKILFVHKVQTR